MRFLNSYKHLERLCGDVLNEKWPITAYIDEMEKTPRGAFLVPHWNEDLKKLKHYRWVRNKITHDPNCDETNMCQTDDALWLDQFYNRIMNQTDPLALYRKATRPIARTKSKQSHKNSQRIAGWLPYLLAAILAMSIIAAVFFRLC